MGRLRCLLAAGFELGKKAKISMMSKELLFAGATVADITPPLEVGLLTSSVNGTYEPFASIRTPLYARVLVVKNSGEMIAVVCLDLLALNDTSVGGWDNFKSEIASAISADRVILTCTHTHNAPESVALSDLYLTDIYKDWLRNVQHKIKGAIDKAISLLKPCRVFIGLDTLAGYSMQRRIPTPGGVIMSDSIQPIAPELLEREPVDRRIHSIRFKDELNNVIATLVHAVCHPVHEMCMPHLSAEFPGELCFALEESEENGIALFLNGAAGDINPPTVSCGPDYAVKHGRAIAKVVENSDSEMIASLPFAFFNRARKFSIRPGSNMTNGNDAMARLSAIRLGLVAILFLPGEPFTQIAYEIEQNSPFNQTIIVAYAENNIGYIPTALALQQGGYEVGPGKWSFLEAGAENILIAEALQLLKELYTN
ncbi:hypothetical protein WAE58_01950 [Pedobacter panaciterrae]|uniref:Neutral/alkaline ceramidase-like enzyme n=1 Tax=Pedobacter panaciterrae TaxID=363849 RepID=A0ABU8NFY3_9SPHI|nr:hypothetical protein [uncultured Pedobacter sp.]